MSQAFFSDREGERRARTKEEISDGAWRGIVTVVTGRFEDGSLAQQLPEYCDDVRRIVSADQEGIYNLLRSLVPDLRGWHRAHEVPSTPVALDLIDFVAQRVAEPVRRSYHPHFDHWHLDFDDEAGKRSSAQTLT